MPSSWLLWDRIRALARANRIFQVDRNFQDQSQLDRIQAGGEFLDWNQQAAILDQTNLHINRLQRYKDYEQMDQMGEISLALDLYADESALQDPERKRTLIIRARSKRIKKILEDLFFNTLMWDSQSRSCVRYLCKFGDCPWEIVPTKNRDGVAALRHMNVYNFTRVETRYGDLVGFFFQDDVLPEPVFLHPWQVMHLRLGSLENIFNPYGRAIIDGGRKSFKQLRLMEDSAIVYRLTRGPEKRKFKIPVGIIPPKEVPEYLMLQARHLKRQRFYNPQTATFDERYSPLIQDDDFFLPQRQDGSGPDVEILQGGQNLDKIEDIDYFKKKMIAPTKIPYARVGIGEGAGQANEKSLASSHSEFAKAVQWVQRETVTGLTKVAIVHMALMGCSVDDMRSFELAMPSSSAIEELYRIETWQTRAQVMADLKELGWFPKEWIVTHFTDLTPDEIIELKEMETVAANGGDKGGEEGDEGGLGGIGGGAGGLDLGGEGGGEDGGEGLGAEGLGGEGGGEGGGEEGGNAGGAEEPAPGLGERIDVNRIKRVLTEMRRQNREGKLRNILERWMRRSGKFLDDQGEYEPIAHFQYLLETKELDGLSKHDDDDERKSTIISESSSAVDKVTTLLESIKEPPKDQTIIGWSTPEQERKEVLQQTLSVLLAEDELEIVEDDADRVTDDDIPQ